MRESGFDVPALFSPIDRNDTVMAKAARRVPRRRKPSNIAIERRQDLIDAAINSIARVGYEAVTVASICEEAGYSRGLIGHYFKGKDELLREAIVSITTELGNSTRQAVSAAGDDPVDRLHAVVHASFRPPGFTPEKVSVWVALASRARWSPSLAEVYRSLWHDYREGIARLVARAATQRGLTIDAALAALTFSQLIEGCWVGWAADSSSITQKKAEAACQTYLDLLFEPRK